MAKARAKAVVSPPVAEFMDTEQASAFTAIPVTTLTTWRSRDRKRGPRFLKVGRSVRYRVADLRAFMERSLRKPGK